MNVRGELAVSYRWTGWVPEIIRLKFKTSGNLPIIKEDFIEYKSNHWIKNRKMSMCNRLDLETLRSWPVLLKFFPNTGDDGCPLLLQLVIHSPLVCYIAHQWIPCLRHIPDRHLGLVSNSDTLMIPRRWWRWRVWAFNLHPFLGRLLFHSFIHSSVM